MKYFDLVSAAHPSVCKNPDIGAEIVRGNVVTRFDQLTLLKVKNEWNEPWAAGYKKGRMEAKMKRKRVQTSTHNYAARAVVVVVSTVCATPYKLFMSSLHIFPPREWRNVKCCSYTLFP